jgi:hypothetical protein
MRGRSMMHTLNGVLFILCRNFIEWLRHDEAKAEKEDMGNE